MFTSTRESEVEEDEGSTAQATRNFAQNIKMRKSFSDTRESREMMSNFAEIRISKLFFEASTHDDDEVVDGTSSPPLMSSIVS